MSKRLWAQELEDARGAHLDAPSDVGPVRRAFDAYREIVREHDQRRLDPVQCPLWLMQAVQDVLWGVYGDWQPFERPRGRHARKGVALIERNRDERRVKIINRGLAAGMSRRQACKAACEELKGTDAATTDYRGMEHAFKRFNDQKVTT